MVSIRVVHPGSGSETLCCWINYFCADAECGGQEADGRAAGGGQEPNGGTRPAWCGHPPLRGRIPGLRASHRQEEDGGPSEQAGSQEQAEGTVTVPVLTVLKYGTGMGRVPVNVLDAEVHLPLLSDT
jgi:hypothetical protein